MDRNQKSPSNNDLNQASEFDSAVNLNIDGIAGASGCAVDCSMLIAGAAQPLPAEVDADEVEKEEIEDSKESGGISGYVWTALGLVAVGGLAAGGSGGGGGNGGDSDPGFSSPSTTDNDDVIRINRDLFGEPYVVNLKGGDDQAVLVGRLSQAQVNDYQGLSDVQLGLSPDIQGVIEASELSQVRAASELVDGSEIHGGAGHDVLHAFGEVDFEKVTLTSIEEVQIHSDVSLSVGQLTGLDNLVFIGDTDHVLTVFNADGSSVSDAVLRNLIRDLNIEVVGDGSITLNGTTFESVEDLMAWASNAPPSILDQAFTVSEFLEGGSEIGEVTASDNDGDVTFSLSSPSDLFAIDENTGELSLLDGAELDFESQASHTVGITATDEQGASSEAVITINVTDAVESPELADDAASGDEDSVITTGNVLSNDIGDNLDGDSIDDFSQGEHGSVEYNGDGTFEYTPDADFSGEDSFTYEVDGIGEATVTVSVNAVNDAPENTVPAALSTGFNAAMPITGLSVSDVDAGNDDMTVELTVDAGTLSAGGDAEVTGNNSASLTLVGSLSDINDSLASLQYQPAQDFVGSATLTIESTDAGGLSDSDSINIAVNDNQATEFGGDLDGEIAEDEASTTGTVSGDDPDGDDDTFISQNDVAGNYGVFSLDTGGNWGYALNGDHADVDALGVGDTLTDSFQIVSADGSSSEVVITIAGTNDAPLVADDSAAGDEDSVITTGNVLDNDGDVDSPLGAGNISSFSQGANGTVQYNGDGTFAYTPGADFNGTDTFTYTLDDGAGGQATGTVTVTVAAVNDAPVAADDVAGGDEDATIVTGNVLANDGDVDGELTGASVVDFTQGAQGAVSYNGDGTFDYVPGGDFGGEDSFTYTIEDSEGEQSTATVVISVNGVNDAPVAQDDVAAGNEDTAITTGNVLTNDSDPDDTLAGGSISAFDQGANGTVAYNGDGTFTYTPDADFNGTDTFTYTVEDDEGASDTATVTVTVTPVNDAPVAEDDTAAGDEDAAIVTGNVLANDTDVDNSLTSNNIVGFTQADNGSVEKLSSGAFRYTPDADFAGSDSFTYTISDGQGGQATATVSLTVNAVNDAPVAGDDQVTGDEDSAITTGNVLANDSDADDAVNTGSISAFSQGDHGQVQNLGNGTFRYTPDADFFGTDTFTYTLTDGDGATDTATVTVTVNAVNDAPVNEAPVSRHTDTNESLSISGLSVEDVDAATLTTVLSVDHGTLQVGGAASVSGNGSGEVTITGSPAAVRSSLADVTYSPDTDFGGTDTLTMETTDDGATPLSDTDTVSITVNAPATIGGDQTGAITENTAGTISGQLTADDPDGTNNRFTGQSNQDGTYGVFNLSTNGSWTYQLKNNASAVDSLDEGETRTESFDIQAQDGTPGTVEFTITGVNDAPTAVNDTASGNEDTVIQIGNVVANDSDPESNLSGNSIISNTTTSNGSLVANPNGTFTYTPDANFSGTDSFSYTIQDGSGKTDTATVTITVNEVNDLPSAGDDSASGNEDTAITTGNVLANDSDADDTLNSGSIDSFTQGANGSVVYNNNGTFTYTPNANFFGNDSFDYTVDDGRGGTATATVSVTVAGINDAPTANNDAAAGDEDTTINISSVLANDVDPDHPLSGSSIIAFSDTGNGSLSHNGNGTFTYTPDANFNGTDSFTYTVEDGAGETDTATVTITVDAVNDLPTAGDDAASGDEDTAITTGNVLANDSDLEDALNAGSVASFTQGAHGSVVYNNNGTFTYTPDQDFNGSDAFSYTVEDGDGGQATATVNITVDPVADAPRANNDSALTEEDQAVTTNVLANDSDPEQALDAADISGFTQASHGTVVKNGNGTFTYTPDSGFFGTDSYTYTLEDDGGLTDTATVNITVTEINDPPVAGDDAASGDEDTAIVTGNVLSNDSDPDDTLDSGSISGFSQGNHGSVAYNNNGTFTYTPDADFFGTDSFTYIVDDGRGESDTATVTITVDPVNDAPDAGNDAVTGDEDTAITTGNVLNNDSDVDDSLNAGSITGFSQGSNGSVSNNGNGTFTYTPDANFNGSDSFTYTVEDGNGGSDTATINVTVTAVNDAPVAADDSDTTAEDAAVSIDVLDNDSDVDHSLSGSSITTFTQGANGSVVKSGTGRLNYTPDANFFGTDTFTYTLDDGAGGTDTATVTVTVTSVNDAPVAIDDSAAGLVDTVITTGNVLDNDTDVDHTLNGASITAFTQASHGSVVNNGDGTFTYTPDAEYIGSDSFTYTVTDGSGATDTATVDLTVNPPIPGTAIDGSTLEVLDDNNIDFQDFADDIVSGIELIHMEQGEDNQVVLGYADLLGLLEDTDETILHVWGEDGDQLVLEDTFFYLGQTAGSLDGGERSNIYQHETDAYYVQVEQDVAVALVDFPY